MTTYVPPSQIQAYKTDMGAPLHSNPYASFAPSGIPAAPTTNDAAAIRAWITAATAHLHHYRLSNARFGITESDVWVHISSSFPEGSAMQRNARDFDAQYKAMWHKVRITDNTAANILIRIANAGKPLDEREPEKDVSPYIPAASSSSRVPHTWVLPAESCEETYRKYIKTVHVEGEASRIEMEANARGALAHAMHNSGLVLENCSYNPVPIAAAANLDHLGLRAPESFFGFLYAKYVHCNAADRAVFMSLKRAPGQSAQDFGNHFLESLRYLCNTCNQKHMPPEAQHQTILINALGGRALLIQQNLHSKAWPAMSLEEIVQRCFEWDELESASVITEPTPVRHNDLDIDHMSASTQAALYKKLGRRIQPDAHPVQSRQRALTTAPPAAPVARPSRSKPAASDSDDQRPNAPCYIHGDNHLNKECRVQQQNSGRPVHTVAVNAAPPLRAQNRQAATDFPAAIACVCCDGNHMVKDCFIAGCKPAPSNLNISATKQRLMQENISRKERGLSWISLIRWQADPGTNPPRALAGAAPAAAASPRYNAAPPQTPGGCNLYQQAVANTIAHNREGLDTTFAQPQQARDNWVHPVQQFPQYPEGPGPRPYPQF